MRASPRHPPPSRHATLERQTTPAHHVTMDRHTTLAERPKRMYSRAAYSRVWTAVPALHRLDCQPTASTLCLSIQTTAASFSRVHQMDSSAAVIPARRGFKVILETAVLPLPI